MYQSLTTNITVPVINLVHVLPSTAYYSCSTGSQNLENINFKLCLYGFQCTFDTFFMIFLSYHGIFIIAKFNWGTVPGYGTVPIIEDQKTIFIRDSKFGLRESGDDSPHF
eukprot:SAG11_NODE_7055_length_1201_cov_5.819419_1_plen_110_part_00